jgi:hypothetical protein
LLICLLFLWLSGWRWFCFVNFRRFSKN